jgi:NADH-quinone oxidoreductase subunit B
MNPVEASVQADRDAPAVPIVVRNTLWQAANPEAYDEDPPSDNTHLAQFAASGLNRRDDARWSGALEIIPTKADVVLDLIRMNSLWPLLSGLACCAIEMISAATSKNDMDRFGIFPFRASPRQADVLIVAGTCTTSRYKRSYSTIQGIDRIMPVDVYIPGCPCRPASLIYGMMMLQQLIGTRRGHWPDRAIGPNVPKGI